jgi:hypothetical protein
MWNRLKEAFQMKAPTVAVIAPAAKTIPNLGTGLLSPGPAYVSPAAVAVLPQPIVAPVVAAQEVVLPVATPAPEIELTPDPDERPIDPIEEASITEPTRTPGRIRFLLKHEDEAATQRRIANDASRHRQRMGRL